MNENYIELLGTITIVIFILSTMFSGFVFLGFRIIKKMNAIEKNTLLFWLPKLGELEYIETFMPHRQAKVLWVLIKVQKFSFIGLVGYLLVSTISALT